MRTLGPPWAPGGQQGDRSRPAQEPWATAVPLAPGAVVFRGNMATVGKDGVLLDRRAGRIGAGVQDLLVDLTNVPLPGGVVGHHPGHEHRLTVILQGPKLSGQVGDTDPVARPSVQRCLESEALDDTPEAARTVEALKALLNKAQKF